MSTAFPQLADVEPQDAEADAYIDIPRYVTLGRSGLAAGLTAAFCLLLTIGFTAAAHMATGAPVTPRLVSTVVVILLILLGTYLGLRLALGGRLDPFTYDLIFLASFYAYNLGVWVLVFLGYIPFGVAQGTPAFEHAAPCLMLCGAAVAAFLAGYLLRGVGLPQAAPFRGSDPGWAASLGVGRIGLLVFLTAVSFRVIYIFFIIGAGPFFRRIYSLAQISETPGGRFYGIAEVLALVGTAAMAVGYAAARRKLAPLVFWPVFLTFVLLLLVDGERGTVMWMLLVLAVVRHRLIKRVRWWAIAVGLLSLVLVFSAVRVARALPERSFRGLVTAMTSGGEGSSLKSTLVETGSAFTIITRSMRWVPAVEDYKYGKTVIPAVVASVPGLPGVTTRALAGYGDWSLYSSPSAWLTFREHGFRSRSGLGFSSLAEAYVNFGPIGVPVVFLLFGFLLRGLEFKSYARPSLMRLAIFAVVAALVFYSSRGTLTDWFRPLAWLAFIVWAARKLLARDDALQLPAAQAG